MSLAQPPAEHFERLKRRELLYFHQHILLACPALFCLKTRMSVPVKHSRSIALNFLQYLQPPVTGCVYSRVLGVDPQVGNQWSVVFLYLIAFVCRYSVDLVSF